MSPSKQGILFVISTPTGVTPTAWNTWYDSEHIPEILKTSGFRTALRYDNVTQSSIFKNPKDEGKKDEFLAIYPIKDLEWLESEEYLSISVSSPLLAESGKSEALCYDVAEFDVRYYSWVDGYEGPEAKNHPEPGSLMISAAMSPPPEEEGDFALWYEKEHYRTLAECRGYLRSRRYRIQKSLSAKGKEAPTFLTIHEFVSDELDVEGLAKSGGTAWSQRVMGGLVENETTLWKMRDGWGDLKVKF